MTVNITSPASGTEIDASEDGGFTVTGTAVGGDAPLAGLHVLIADEIVHEQPAWVGDTTDWSVTLAPPATGTYAIQVVVSDGDGAYGSDTVTVTVTDIPEAAPGGVIESPLVVNLTPEELDALGLQPVTYPVETLRFDSTQALPFQPGEILVTGISETTPEGLAVRILAIADDDGGQTVETGVAALADLFLFLDTTMTAVLVPDKEAGDFLPASDDDPICGSFAFNLNASLSDSAGPGSGSLSITNSHYETCVDVLLRLKLSRAWWDPRSELEEFRYELGASQSLGADIELSGELDLFDYTNPSSDWHRRSLRTFVFPVGKVPVVVTPELLWRFQAVGSIEADFASSFGTNAGFRTGITYNPTDGWDTFANAPASFSVSPPAFDGATLNTQAGPSAGIEARFYGTGGPRGVIDIRAQMEVYQDDDDEPWFKAGFMTQFRLQLAGARWLDRFLPTVSLPTVGPFELNLYEIPLSDPELIILSPSDGAVLPCCDVVLQATAQGGGAEDDDITWRLDTGQFLGTGGTVRITLPDPGEYVIEASLPPDGEGEQVVKSVTIEVSDEAGDFRVVQGVSSAGALALAQAMATEPGRVVGAQFVTLPPSGTPNGIAINAPGQTSSDDTAGIMTTGSVFLADTPNMGTGEGAALGGGNVRGDTDYDVSILRISYDVPPLANCLRFHFRFLSEEYPEWVGSAFNDAFIAELNTSTWTTQGSNVLAPNNFAQDPTGNPITVNSLNVHSLSAVNAFGTTYDGATMLLRAATLVTPGVQDLYLSIFDQGDMIFDSAVFVSDLEAITVPDSTYCRSGAAEVPGQ